MVQAIEEAEAASEPSPDGTTEETAEGDDDDWSGPEVGETWKYAANSRATAKECVVTTVNQSQQTCTLKRSEDDHVFKSVAWDKLIGED